LFQEFFFVGTPFLSLNLIALEQNTSQAVINGAEIQGQLKVQRRRLHT
jgi:hypothetical protein